MIFSHSCVINEIRLAEPPIAFVPLHWMVKVDGQRRLRGGDGAGAVGYRVFSALTQKLARFGGADGRWRRAWC